VTDNLAFNLSRWALFLSGALAAIAAMAASAGPGLA